MAGILMVMMDEQARKIVPLIKRYVLVGATEDELEASADDQA